ncbi:MAG: DNA polymerase III subunit gamma/tau [Acidimicrobiia bacterium]
MAYQSLYRRYRSRRFSEVRGQPHVTTALRNSVRDGRVGHAYLFSGPRGTGKTSTARILAKVLNCTAPVDGEPCLECASCVAVEAGTSFDVHELDAASNRGIDDIRRLIESAAMVSGGRTKLYILDEVHMLTEAAENALLKTLEEPPAHVVFVLATTDPQKVRSTIKSRAQHYEFHLLSTADLDELVRWVIADAGLDVGPDAIEHVLRVGAGSARDTLSALDQVVATGGVVERVVVVDDLVDGLIERDIGRLLSSVAESVSAGRDPRTLAQRLIERLRDVFLAAMKAPLDHLSDADRDRAVALSERVERSFLTRSLEVLGEALSKAPETPDPRILFETALVRIAVPEADTTTAALLERIERLERTIAGAGLEAGGPWPAGSQDASPAEATRPAAAARQVLRQARQAGAIPPALPTAPPDGAGAAGAEEPPRQLGPPPAAAPPDSAGLPSRDQLTLAWGDTVLGALPRTVKARYSVGRFVSVDGAGARFALPNEPHRKRCEEQRPEVERALAAHFGRPVPLVLVVEEHPAAGAADRAEPAGADESRPEEIEDVHQLADAAPDHRSGLDRLAEAFPGAQLIEEEP